MLVKKYLCDALTSSVTYDGHGENATETCSRERTFCVEKTPFSECLMDSKVDWVVGMSEVSRWENVGN